MCQKNGCWYRFIILALALALVIPALVSCGSEEKPVPHPLTPTPRPTPDIGQQPAEGTQRIEAYFETAWVHDATTDSLTNAEIHGSKEWRSGIKNMGVPLAQLELTLESKLAFEYLTTENLSRMGPPTYGWSFGNVLEGDQASADVGLGPTPEEFMFTPGFDVSRSLDNIEFSEPDTQTLTVTVAQREAIGELIIMVCADENDYVAPVITYPVTGDYIELSQDGHKLTIEGMPVEINTPMTVTVNISVMPKMSKVEFMPYVWVGWRETINTGLISGNSVTYTDDDLVTRTWRVPWNGDWTWEEYRSYAIRWSPRSGGLAAATNQIFVGFGEELSHSVSGDTFTNGEVTGEMTWRITNVMNTADETGASVTGIGITLTSSLVFDGLSPYPPDEMGPPTYRWYFGDLVERPQQTGWEVDATAMLGSPRYPFTITPGFDVSRSFNKVIFSAPDTQTITITVTPREEWLKNATIAILALENDLVDPVIVSYSSSSSAEEVRLIPDGHGLYFNFIPVEFNAPLTINAVIQVMPKVPMIEYKPRVVVIPEKHVISYMGTTRGSSVSYTMEEVGTWTVTAEGNYVWNWMGPRGVRGTVALLEKTELQ